jgi:hypothetical protein
MTLIHALNCIWGVRARPLPTCLGPALVGEQDHIYTCALTRGLSLPNHTVGYPGPQLVSVVACEVPHIDSMAVFWRHAS